MSDDPLERGGAVLTALVLAAGLSRRFGANNKLLAGMNGTTLLGQSLTNLAQSGVEDIVVVSGHQDDLIRAAIPSFKASVVYNPDFEMGMGRSIAAGMMSVRDRCNAVMICLGDMPFIKPNTYCQLIRSFSKAQAHQKIITVPILNGRRGHPVIFGKNHFSALSNLNGADGARQIIQANHDYVIEVLVDDPGIHQDLDTPEDYFVTRD